MKERSKESKERKVVVVAEEKNEKEKATTTSRAGRAHEECPLNVVTQEDIDRFVDIFNETMIHTRAVIPTVDILTTQVERGYRKTQKLFTSLQVRTIVSYLGEP